MGETKKARHLNFCYQASIYGSGDADLRKNLISPRECFLCGPDAAKEIPMTRLGFVLTMAAVLAGVVPASAQQQPAPAPSDR